MDMDRPFPASEQAKAILELGLYRNKAERELLEAKVADDERRRILWEKHNLMARRTRCA